jgi:hypothetical protein
MTATIIAMRKSPLGMLSCEMLIGALAGLCNALPQATTSTTLAPIPSATVIPWETKVDGLHEYVLQQPDQNATQGFWNGPSLTKTFADGECLQIRFYNWDCFHDITYKMRGVTKFLDDTNVRSNNQTIWDRYRYYTYGYYADPDNGWNFYAVAHLSFGACGNRGPQSACGVIWCVDKEGKTVSEVPQGQTPYVDPNNRSRICPWLSDNETTSHAA